MAECARCRGSVGDVCGACLDAAVADARNAALDEAAKNAEASGHTVEARRTGMLIAANIRALKTEGNGD